MKKIIFLLLFTISINCTAGTVNIWYTESATATQGDQFKISFKCSYSNLNDVGRIYIKDLSSSVFVEVYNFKIIDKLDETPTGQDNTYEVIVTIPSYTDNCEFFTSSSTMPNVALFVNTATSILSYQEAERLYKITYYNIQGIEIKKPNEGFFIWKAENGLNGKAYIY